MKVLLFVQAGNARPKCVKSFGDRRHNAMNYFNAIRPRFGSLGQPECGWLVECENAEAGRALIHAAELVAAARRFVGRKDAPACITGRLPEGRIIESGGRQ